MTRSDFENLYQERVPIGSGGFAEVYKTFDHAKGCYVALKSARVRPEHRQYTLKREVELVNQLTLHPNIARYESCYRFDMGLAGEMDFAIMEFYENGNLEQFLNSRALNVEEVKTIVQGILLGVGFLHQNNITHRDLKAQNILLKREFGVWSPKIADFGLARQLSFDQVVTDTSIGISYAYAAPEQIKGLKISKAVDIWAVGVIVYRVLAGELPFKSQNADAQTSQAQSELIRKITNLELPEKLSTIPEPYQSLIRRCLVLDPTTRAQSTQELLSLLDPRHRAQDFDERTVPFQPPPIPFVPLQPTPPPPPPVDDEKTVQLRSAEVVVPKQPEIYQPPAPQMMVPPTNYVQPKADVTQFIPTRLPDPPPAEVPAPPVINSGDPGREFKWWWVLLPLLLACIAVGVYLFLNRKKNPPIRDKVDLTTPATKMAEDWRKPYDVAMQRGLTDSHEEGHRHTFYLFASAADIAIRQGKSHEMAKQMLKDANSPTMKRINHGHHEWAIIENAIAKKNLEVLKPLLKY